MSEGWIGVDLDGTLAFYDQWRGEEHVGEPIPLMLARVQEWLKDGKNVKIFTARANNGPKQIEVIHQWCEKNGLPRLEVTATKDFGMIVLFDDRCYRVEENTGIVKR